MSKRSTAELKRRSGADLRAQRDSRLGATGPAAEATRRAQSIRDGLNSFANAIEEMAEAYNRQDWKTLGYASWQDYCQGEFGPRVRLSAEQRKQATASLAAAGLTKRAAAAALGVSHTTIQNDASGKKLPLAVIEGQVKTDAEVADQVTQATASFDEKYSGDVDGKGDVSGQDPPDHSVDELQASDQGPGPSTPADPSLDQVALVADQPGPDSPLARGETPVPAGVAQPPELVPGEEPVPVAPAAAGEIAASPAAQNLTEEQAPTPLAEPVLSPSGAVGVADGDTAEEEAGGEAGSSSADPASAWMDAWRTFRSAVYSLDIDAVKPLLPSYDRDEMGEDWPQMAERLEKLVNP